MRLDHKKRSRSFTKTRNWVRLQNIHTNLDESLTERPQSEEKLLCTRVTLSQELAHETSLDNLELRPRQQRRTLATRNSRTNRGSNRHRRTDKRMTKRNPTEEEAWKEGRLILGGGLKCKALSNGTGVTRRTRTKGEVKSGMPNQKPNKKARREQQHVLSSYPERGWR